MHNSTRILFLCSWYYPDSVGGTEAYVQSLAKEFKSIGLEVTVAAPAEDGEERRYVHEGILVYRYPVFPNSIDEGLSGKKETEYFDFFVNWLDKIKPDIAHVHSFTQSCGWQHIEYIKKLNIPLVFTMHASDLFCIRGTMLRWGKLVCDGKMRPHLCAACYLQRQGIPKLFAWLVSSAPVGLVRLFKRMQNRVVTALTLRNNLISRRNLLEEILSSCDRICVVSRWLYDALIINGALKERLVYLWVGLPANYIMQKAQRKVIVQEKIRFAFIGRFTAIKGVELLVKAIKKLPARINVELCLYGRLNNLEDAAYFNKLKKISYADTRISFCGEITEANRREIFSKIDVLVVPSLCLEAGPLVALEANAFGIPVIGSNVGGMKETIIDGFNGILFEVGNVRSLTEAIKRIYFNPGLIKVMSEGISQVKEVGALATKVFNVYSDILSIKRGSI